MQKKYTAYAGNSAERGSFRKEDFYVSDADLRKDAEGYGMDRRILSAGNLRSSLQGVSGISEKLVLSARSASGERDCGKVPVCTGDRPEGDL